MAFTVIAGLVLAQASAAVPEVGFEELSEGRNQAAIVEIELNSELDADDPARLINLGIAHAREGRAEQAREMFRAALRSDTPLRLETATGDWVDSRTLARQALAMLDRGEFATPARVAAR